MEGERKTGSGFWGFEPQTSKFSLRKRREKGAQLIILQARIANRELTDSHTCLLFVYFATSLILPRFQHILRVQNHSVSKGATQDSSLSEFQTQKSGGSSGVFPSLAHRIACICAAWLRACLHMGRSCIPLPEEADDRQ